MFSNLLNTVMNKLERERGEVILTSRISVKRVYESVTETDGTRVLVDRLWPRGISKEDKRIDEWCKEVAPSRDLRIWFHEHGDFPNFAKKYRQELKESKEANEALQKLCRLARETERLTLVYASKDEEQNNALVLKQVMEEILHDE